MDKVIQDLAGFLGIASCELGTGNQVRETIKKTAENAAELYGDSDLFGVRQAIATFAAKVDETIRNHRQDSEEPARKMSDLAKEALRVQNASNLSGLVHGWSRAIVSLRLLLPEASTDEINTHPVNFLWANKLADLTQSKANVTENYTDAFEACTRLAEDES